MKRIDVDDVRGRGCARHGPDCRWDRVPPAPVLDTAPDHGHPTRVRRHDARGGAARARHRCNGDRARRSPHPARARRPSREAGGVRPRRRRRGGRLASFGCRERDPHRVRDAAVRLRAGRSRPRSDSPMCRPTGRGSRAVAAAGRGRRARGARLRRRDGGAAPTARGAGGSTTAARSATASRRAGQPRPGPRSRLGAPASTSRTSGSAASACSTRWSPARSATCRPISSASRPASTSSTATPCASAPSAPRCTASSTPSATATRQPRSRWSTPIVCPIVEDHPGPTLPGRDGRFARRHAASSSRRAHSRCNGSARSRPRSWTRAAPPAMRTFTSSTGSHSSDPTTRRPLRRSPPDRGRIPPHRRTLPLARLQRRGPFASTLRHL